MSYFDEDKDTTVLSHEIEISLLLLLSSIDTDSTSEWPFVSELQWLRRRRRAVSVIMSVILDQITRYLLFKIHGKTVLKVNFHTFSSHDEQICTVIFTAML